MIDSEFRAALHRQLGPALDELVAPDLLDRVRARQVGHKRSVRAGLALSASATVAAVVVAIAVWPNSGSAGPTAPASTLSTPAVPSSAELTSPAPSPSTAIVNLAGLAPLLTSGPCAGLTVGAFLPSHNLHPAVTALTSAGAAFTTVGQQAIALKAKGPCVDRLSFLSRTATFQNDLDVPYSFINGEGAIFGRVAPSNQTGVVQFFVDCKGLACSASGDPLATLTVKVTGTAPEAASLPFAAAPTPLPFPSGGTVTVPSVIGLHLEAAERVLRGAGLGGIKVAGGVAGPARGIILQSAPVGSVVPKGSTIDVIISGDGSPPGGLRPSVSVAPPTSAAPSLPPPMSSHMPVVVGAPARIAEQVLKAAHITYRVNYQPDAAKAGIVLYQSPVAGTLVRPETQVVLTVGIDPRAAPSTGGSVTLRPN